MSGFLPDVNVLVALTLGSHRHSAAVHTWYIAERRPVLAVCRVTQLSFLRLMTSVAAAEEDVMSNSEAWSMYSELVQRRNLSFMNEPEGLERSMASVGGFGKPAPKLWADAYLAAFASHAALRIVTFDRALARMAPKSILLRG